MSSQATFIMSIFDVFLPAELRYFTSSVHTLEHDHSLVRAVCAASQTYSEIIDDTLKPKWRCIAKMLDNLKAFVQSKGLDKDHVISQLRGMQTGDILAFFNPAQDAAVIFRKRDHFTLYESFQTSWDSRSIYTCSYPEWAIEIPGDVFHDGYFQSELTNFLLYQDEISGRHDLAGHTTYTKLLTSILRGVGCTAEVLRITKHHSHCTRFHHPRDKQRDIHRELWFRSSIWLLIKVAIQTSLDHGGLGRICYKVFMLRFMCNLAKDAIDANLSSRLLHAISAKILRRLTKLGTSAPNWLHDMVLKTSASLRKTLEARWKEVEATQPPSSLWKPSQLDLDRDTQLSLRWSLGYIRNSLTNPAPQLRLSPFCPEHLPRGTLNDFFSSNGRFLEEAYRVDPHVALYDVEYAVEQGIDDWIAGVTNVAQACVQLEILMDEYLSKASRIYHDNPDNISILFLTAIDLWIALDKIIVGAVPMLADYSPEVPTGLLHMPLLRKTMSLHRLSRAYQYLSARRSRSLPGQSVFSDECTKTMFPTHYNVNTLPLDLRHDMEKVGRTIPSDAKITVLELRCPVYLHIWRSGTARLLGTFLSRRSITQSGERDKGHSVYFANISRLQPYLVRCWTSSFTRRIYLAYFAPSGLQPWDIFCRISEDYRTGVPVDYFAYRLPSSHSLEQYINATSHTSNGVLAAQAECSDELSLDEFIAFGHLRSGGSLQWVNILRQLRSRTLNFRRHDVYLLLAQAASQVGPLDLHTAKWVWHQELQESSFCSALLDELESLLVDVAVHSLDGVMMGTISSLLTRLLASSPCEDVSERAIGLLQRVRSKTFHWVQELSYNLTMAPTKTERSELLRDMAVTCRSTFDVGPDIVHKVLRSAEDIDALLSCAIFIHANSATRSRSFPEYSKLILERDCRLSLALESVLRDIIQADASNRGIDLAVRHIWSGYRPGLRRWQSLPCPNSHWLICETAATGSRRSQIVHLNLLNGSLLVDGKPIDRLPHAIRKQPTYQRIFGDQRFLALASDLPGMDFATLALISEHRIHFALQGGNLVIRAQHKDMVDILELIPQEKLEHDLPTAFVHGHVHWLNLSTSVIEIRPLERIWEQASDNWRIDCASGQYRMYKGREWLVDIRSPTCEMVSSRLRCLDGRKKLIIATSPFDTPRSSPTRRLSVVLPRYGLSFFVNEDGDLESRDFKDMVYDENQCVGTLFGLENRLVLRPRVQVEEELIHRCVIIPNGQISCQQRNHHAQISINTMSTNVNARSLPTEPVTYHTYHVDTDLGCLTGYASWGSRLYLAHLHAQTSVDWMPDPLTGRTGIQEALCLLRSAGCRSIMELGTRHGEPELLFSLGYKMYPQIRFAIEEIQYLIKRERFLRNSASSPLERPKLDVVAALETAHLFPMEGPIFMPTSVRYSKFLEHEDLAYTVSLAVYHWLINTVNGAESGRDTSLADTLLRAPAWANPEHLPPSIAEVDALLQEVKESPRYWRDRHIPPPSIAEVDALLQQATEARQRFRLLFLLPTIIYYQRDPQPPFLSILVALAKQSPLESLLRCAECRPLDGYPSRDALRECFDIAQRHSVSGCDNEAAVDQVFAAWPSKTAPVVPLDADCYHVKWLNTELQRLFSSCCRNLKLKQDLTHCLGELETKPHTLPNQALASGQASDSPSEVHCRMPWQVTLGQLLCDRSAPKLPAPSRLRHCGHEGIRLLSDSGTHASNQLFASLRVNKTDPSFQQHYISRLHASARHVREAPRMTCGAQGRPSTEELLKYYVQCRKNYVASLTTLKKELGPMDDPLGQALHRSGQWPQITPDTLFQCLASTSPIKLPDGWKQCLVSLALLLLELQRARRLLQLALDNLEEELSGELENEGCDGWSAEEYPDWLLIQLQGNFLIRGIQADVAMKMISPPTRENTVMQVNMGEGKSSVILPISVATLADGNQLVRVIVPKALTVQISRLLVVRLGGLTNRPIYHLPFSRSLTGNYSCSHFKILREVLSECMCNRGILIVHPEDVLSLKLTNVQKQLPKDLCDHNGNSHSDTSQNLFNGDPEHLAPNHAFMELQTWFDSCARDVLDESDDVLHPRFQLIYTIGFQQHMEGYPDQWTIAQQVLRLVKKHALSLSHDLPDAIEYERSASGSFPRIRILRASDARQRLISLIVDDVMEGHLPNFSLRDLDRDRRLRAAVRAFISSEDVFRRTASMVEEYARKSILWDGILLLRGLLACNILLFALAERRWRVDYGLSPTRTMLAVPYRAKDVPASRAEFGHPDITTVLTCLSYYYGGLTEEQLRASFEILQEQDDPSMEYANWLRDYDPDTVPESIQDLSNVNIKSSEQWDKYLFPLFARNQGAVDFYLSRVVFPKEAKEFPRKLAASSWDLAQISERPITGFSGTNDGQDMLPTSITQRDLDHQRGTNARVLSHLLQSENNSYTLISHTNGERRTTLELLRMVVDQEPKIRVFLDVGAQILDFSNHQLAQVWLDLSSDSDGAIYFNKRDELMVLTKDGTKRTLVSSPLAQRLDRCVVYLDDAHTRGTDLKLPSGSRAAVTLGPKVTKDRLVQGCMRMRKLGHGHSVMFFAPLEVDRSIRAVAVKEDLNIPVNTTDILRWAIHETWTDIQHRAPYWAQQGISHNSQYDAWSGFCSNELTREQLADAWLQPELKSLADLYAPFQPKNAPSYSSILDDHPEIQQRCIDLGVLKLPEARMEEEQEREVNREIEREREVQRRPPNAKPAKHSLHPDVVAFVRTGVIPPSHTGCIFHPVFTTLERSSVATSKAHVWSLFVLATSDFCKTIEPASCQGRMDQYLRPVQWVLSGKKHLDRVLVLISPFEADCLMPDIRVSKHVHLHVYTPRTSDRMRPADDLMFYSIPLVPDNWTPPWHLIDQLNIFAGQLYLRDYGSSLRLRHFLGVHTKGVPDDIRTAVRHNLFVPSGLEEIENTFTDSPLRSVMMLLAIRRRGLPFAETHMGRILQGQQLTERDFNSPVWAMSGRNPTARDAQTLHSFTSATTGEDGSKSSVLSQSSKRKRETIDPSDGDSGRPQKRLRGGQQ